MGRAQKLLTEGRTDLLLKEMEAYEASLKTFVEKIVQAKTQLPNISDVEKLLCDIHVDLLEFCDLMNQRLYAVCPQCQGSGEVIYAGETTPQECDECSGERMVLFHLADEIRIRMNESAATEGT